jgi:hypothetical protein
MRFACDVMLGRLAKYLRILGFDTIYLRNLAALGRLRTEDDPRYFLTRRKSVTGYDRTIYIGAETVRAQLAELNPTIRDAIDLQKVLSRCIGCNVLLEDVEKKSIEHLVPEFVFHAYQGFKQCPACGRVYWQGTHTTQMSRLIGEMTE